MNTPSESTSATLEDLPANAQPDQQIPQGDKPEGNAEPAAPAPETKAPDDKATPPPKAETPVDGKAKPSDAPADDPEKAAIERLRSDAPKAEPAKKPDAQPTAKAGEAKQPTGNAAEPKPEDGKPTTTAAAGEGEDDPLKDWTEQERKHTKGTIKAKFRDLHHKVQELAPDAEAGRAWNEVIHAEKIREDVEVLTDKQLAWSLKSQAAAIRAVQAVQQGRTPTQADMDILNRLRQGIAEVDRAIGYRGQPTDPAAIGEAFTGPIPDDLKEAGEIAGLSQAEIKVLAALRAAPRAKQQPAAPAPSAPVPQATPAPQQQRATEHQQVAQQSPAEALYARKSNAAIAEVCGDPQKARAYFDLHIAPVIEANLRRDYPGRDPAQLFVKFGPAERHQLVVDAVQAHVAAKAASQTTHQSQPAGRAPMRSGGGGTGPGAPVDPEQAAIARLRSD